MKRAEIKFTTIADFEAFCASNAIEPMVEIDVKKHSNMRGEFFHLLYGEFNLNGLQFTYKINEKLVKKEKIYKTVGCKLSEIWN